MRSARSPAGDVRGLVPALRALLGPTGAAGDSTDEAWRRAEQLLAESLTPQQHAAYVSNGFVEVPSRKFPDRTYRIDGWRPVAVHERGRFIGAVCIRPREHLPPPDVLLARKLMIEGAEDDFLGSGNLLQPAWRPAGAAPTLFVLFALLSPWLLHLRVFGGWGIAGGAAILAIPAIVFVRRRSGRTRDADPAGRLDRTRAGGDPD